MKNSIDSKMIYRIFAIIQEKGIEQADGWHYMGLVASSDQDGYNISIQDPKVSLSLGFHHSYQLDYKNSLDGEEFNQKLLAVYRSKK